MSVCDRCGGDDFDTNDAAGETYCRSCGNIIEQDKLVSTISFSNNGSGGKTANGTVVGVKEGMLAAIGTGSSIQSRESVLARAFGEIQMIADHLKLSTFLVEGAQRMYALAVNSRLTMGRRRERVAAACLYTMCRRDKKPFLLVDFADSLEIPVRKLGQTFMQLCRGLHISELPSVDPSLFLDRFTQQVPMFCDNGKQKEVATTAIKVIQSMKRDWLATGRRPNGIIGASLIVAARIHEFKINPEDVAHMCRISTATINFRLKEFRSTALALTCQDFDEVCIEDLVREELPPALKRQRKHLAIKMAGLTHRRRAVQSLLYRAGSVENEDMPDVSVCIENWGKELQLSGGTDEILKLYDKEFEHADAVMKSIKNGTDAYPDDLQEVTGDSNFDDMFTEGLGGGDVGTDNLMNDLFTGTMNFSGIEDNNLNSTFESTMMTNTNDNENIEPSSDIFGVEGGFDPFNPCNDDDDDMLSTNNDNWDMFGDTGGGSEGGDDIWGGDLWNQDKTNNITDNAIAIREESSLDKESELGEFDSDEFSLILLNKQECRAKTLLWDELTKNILPELYSRRQERERRDDCQLESSRFNGKNALTDTEAFFADMSLGDREMFGELF